MKWQKDVRMENSSVEFLPVLNVEVGSWDSIEIMDFTTALGTCKTQTSFIVMANLILMMWKELNGLNDFRFKKTKLTWLTSIFCSKAPHLLDLTEFKILVTHRFIMFI